MPDISVLRLLVAAAAVVVASMPAHGATDSERFRGIHEEEWAFRIRELPLWASSYGFDEHRAELGHVAEADQRRRYERWQAVRTALETISCERLTPAECIDYRLYVKQIDDFIAAYETRSYLIPFNSDWGFYMEWGRLPADTDFRKLQDYRDYLSRLRQMGPVMDEYIALMRAGIEQGMTQPRVVLTGRDGPILRHVVEDARESPFFAPFRNMPAALDGPERAAVVAEALDVIAGIVVPAFGRLYGFFHDEYVPGARRTLGASELPGGERFYRAEIRRHATVDLSPQEIHDIGLAEVARIRQEMDEIIAAIGFEGDFAAFIDFLRNDPRFYAKTPRELLATASYYAKKIDGRMPMLFGQLPRQPYGVAAVPAELAPFYTAGRYVPAPADARRGGYYWVNTWALDSRPLYAIPALTLHEGAPGHHTQYALALEQQNQPVFRRTDHVSAYSEGWGLYAEKLGVEMDIYETPYEHFGRLTYEMWRACRLVIDTGIHALGWSREQAQEYLASRTALSVHEVTTEVDRYISWPGQALSYKLGEYTLWKLRREAEAELGERFDVRSFHDFILALGSVTLEILQDEVRGWIARQRASA